MAQSEVDYAQRIAAMSEVDVRTVLTCIAHLALDDPDYDDETGLRTDGEAVAECVLCILSEWGMNPETSEDDDV